MERWSLANDREVRAEVQGDKVAQGPNFQTRTDLQVIARDAGIQNVLMRLLHVQTEIKLFEGRIRILGRERSHRALKKVHDGDTGIDELVNFSHVERGGRARARERE